MRPRRRRVEQWLRRGTTCGHAKTAATCRDILALAPAMWPRVFIGDLRLLPEYGNIGL